MVETSDRLKENFEIELRKKYHLKCKKKEVHKDHEDLEALYQPKLKALLVAERSLDQISAKVSNAKTELQAITDQLDKERKE